MALRRTGVAVGFGLVWALGCAGGEAGVDGLGAAPGAGEAASSGGSGAADALERAGDNAFAVAAGGAVREASSTYREDYSAWMAVDDFDASSWCAGPDTGAGQSITVERTAPVQVRQVFVTTSDWEGETPVGVAVSLDGQPLTRIEIPRDAAPFTRVAVPVPVTAGRSLTFVFDAPRSAGAVCIAEVGAGGEAAPAPQADFTGSWRTGWQFGDLSLRQDGARLEGCFGDEGTPISGTVDGDVALLEWDHNEGKGLAALRRTGDAAAAGVTRYQSGEQWTGAAAFQAERLAKRTPCRGERPPAKADPFGDALAKSGRVVLEGLLFDFGSDRLRPASEATLDAAAATLKAHADWKVVLEGHTDSVGSDASNLDLSQRRAAAVRQALVARGIAEDRLSSEGFGEARPAFDNAVPLGRARNRRVELVLR